MPTRKTSKNHKLIPVKIVFLFFFQRKVEGPAKTTGIPIANKKENAIREKTTN